MNPVTSYSEFMDYMRHNYNHDTLVPVLLIEPSTIFLLNEAYHLQYTLNCMFDRFDILTGDKLIYFLPGYAHYPGLSLSTIFQGHRPIHENDSIIEITRLGNIYYNNKYFTDFIEQLEIHAPDFDYFGATELLLIKYIATPDSTNGDFEYSNINRYNLSEILIKNHRIRAVEHFLHMVVETMCKRDREGTVHTIANMERVLAEINQIYKGFVTD